MQEQIYYFDQIRINSKRKLENVSQILKDNGFKIAGASDVARRYGFETSIEMVIPSKETFSHLKQHEQAIWPYNISYLEVAKDIFFDSDSEADSWVGKRLETMRKRWSFGGFIYDQFKENDKQRAKRKFDAVRFGTRTGYFGSKDFKFVIYARRSKVNKQPCAHLEWRILHSSNIRKRTRIATIDDLVGFDCKVFFENTYKKFITYGEIDREKLGKWLEGIDSRRKNLSKTEKRRIELQVCHFLNAYGIETYSDLVDYLKQEKEKIMHQKGPRSEWSKKILSIKSYGRFRASLFNNVCNLHSSNINSLK
jgi:hypothetical protein